MKTSGKSRPAKRPALLQAMKSVPANGTVSFNEICTMGIELRHTKPLIWRHVEVPTSVALKVLHDIIQISMGWFDCHLWAFTIDGQTFELPQDEDDRMPPGTVAMKVRLRHVLKPAKTIIDYVYYMGDS